MNVSFSEHEIAVIILRCMPRIYNNQYWLPTNFILTALLPLYVKLDAISRVSVGIKQKKARGSLECGPKWQVQEVNTTIVT